MGKILQLKNKSNDKVEVTLELTQAEIERLKGNLDKMHLFSENILENNTRLVQRGKRDSTKYFLLPKDFKSGIMISDNVPCTRIETKSKYLYVFSVKKY